MSYLVFARKWRPQSFEDVLAQDHVTVTLRNAIENGRIGHAYLFTGPRGVGKTTTARILAKALNCEKGPTPSPCQVCESCRRITAGSDMDVLEIDGASNRGIDEVRELREQARYSAAGGRWKIYIVDEVHMLTREAFNALLKILEEPPDFVIFVFATTEPRKVPATIISRCQRFDFRRIPVQAMSGYLAKEAAGEGIGIDAEALSIVCRSSGGSMRDALSIMDQLVSFSGGEITRESAEGLLRVVEVELLDALSRSILSGRAAEALNAVDEAFARGYSVEELCDAFIEHLRNLMLCASGGTSGLSDLSDREVALLEATASLVDDTAILNVLRIITGAASEVRTSSLPRVVLESAVLASARMCSAVGVADLPAAAVDRVPRVPRVRRDTAGPAPVPPAGRPGPARISAAAERVEEPAPAKETGTGLPGPAPSEEQPGANATAVPEAVGHPAAPDEGEAEEEKKATIAVLDLFDAVSTENTLDRRSN